MDREKVIAWLADEELYYRDHGDMHNSLMACNAIALLKQQEHKDKMFHALEDDWKRLKELLKEQEAKPVDEHGRMFSIRYGSCPNCLKPIDSDVNPKACGHCGQAVKWE